MLLIGMFAGRTLAFGAERPINPPTVLRLQPGHQSPIGGIVAAAAIRQVTRLAALDALAAQSGVTQKKRSGGHPVLIRQPTPILSSSGGPDIALDRARSHKHRHNQSSITEYAPVGQSLSPAGYIGTDRVLERINESTNYRSGE
jgi:hypothetical protein